MDSSVSVTTNSQTTARALTTRFISKMFKMKKKQRTLLKRKIDQIVEKCPGISRETAEEYLKVIRAYEDHTLKCDGLMYML